MAAECGNAAEGTSSGLRGPAAGWFAEPDSPADERNVSFCLRPVQ
uniref:Uncharacterized protein n=1 Tax=Anguilla anguilla TaxID=7936 RepID=A0A0E9WBV4_ANGAN